MDFNQFIQDLTDISTSLETNRKAKVNEITLMLKIMSKFNKNLSKSQRNQYKKDINYIADCLKNAYDLALERERKLRIKILEISEELEMRKAIDRVNEMIENNEISEE